MHACVRGSAAECGEVRAAAEGKEGWMEGWMNAPGSGILFCHLCCQAEWLTGCLSAQCAGMIGSWPAGKRPASFTYIHISRPLSCRVCCMCTVCV